MPVVCVIPARPELPTTATSHGCGSSRVSAGRRSRRCRRCPAGSCGRSG